MVFVKAEEMWIEGLTGEEDRDVLFLEVGDCRHSCH